MAMNIPARLQAVIDQARARDASDIFLIPGEPPALRVRGAIERGEDDPLTPDEVADFAAAIIGKDKLQKIGDEVGLVNSRLVLPGEPLANARAGIARSNGNVSVVIRIFPPRVCTLEEVGYPKAMLGVIAVHWGLVVLCGRVGSGVNTSAYSLLDHINSEWPSHICTVEDPIVTRITPKKALVQQREVGVDAPNTLAGIRAAMAQDLDVLFVPEVKCLEDLEACLTAAETGHLVITELNGVGTPEGAIQRMVEGFPDDVRPTIRRIIAGVLRGISYQRLLCRADRPGRVAAYGVLLPDEEMRAAIAEGRDFMVRRTPMPAGCQTLEDDIHRMQREGIVSEDEARKALADVAVNRVMR